MTCIECGADALDGLCAVCLMEYARRDLDPPPPQPLPDFGREYIDWYVAAGHDTEYARTDEPREQADCCPNCGSSETHIECYEDEEAA